MQRLLDLMSPIDRMNQFYFVIFFCLIGHASFSQVNETNTFNFQTNRWIFGNGVDLEFVDTGIIQRPIDFYSYECSTIKKIKNKLYYTNGEYLFLNNDTIKKLDGNNSASEGAYIAQLNDSIFEIYTTESIPTDSIKIYQYKINSLTNKLIEKRLLALNAREQLGIVNHRNNYTSWIASHFGSSDSMMFFLQGKTEFICPVIAKGGINYSYFRLPQLLGINTEFSYSGGKLLNNPYGLVLDLFDFDNEKLIYTSHGNKLYQYDIKNDFLRLIKSNDLPFDNWGELQVSPKGQILLANRDKNYLSAIMQPDNVGESCNFVDTFISLNYGISQRGLPNFNASYFYTPSIDFAYTEDCWGHGYSFEGRDTLQATSWKWLFRDIRNNTTEVRQGKNVNYTFPQADSLENKYEVSHIASTATRSDTVTKTLTIRPKWEQDVLGRDTFYCTGASINLNLIAPPNMHCVHWNGEEPNLDESLGAIVDYDHFHTDTLRVDTAGTYIVKLTNKTFCQAWDTITISEIPNPNKPNIQRKGQEIESNTVAAKYTWYLDGKLKFQTKNQTQIPNSNGYWQVQLVSEYGCESELSDSFYVGFASIRDVRLEMLDFRLYPNPSDGKVTIEVPKKGVYKIVVTDLQGKVIYSEKQLLSLSFELEFEFAKGNYIITLIDENGQVGSKQMEVVN